MPRKRSRHCALRRLIALVLAGSLLSAARAPAQLPAPPAARAPAQLPEPPAARVPAQLPAPPAAPPTAGWTEAVLQARTRPSAWAELERAFPIPCDWARQDLRQAAGDLLDTDRARPAEQRLLNAVLDELGAAGAELRKEAGRLPAEGAELRQEAGRLPAEGADTSSRTLSLYLRACDLRRGLRLAPLAPMRRFVFTRHHNLGGSHYAYTEAVSDARAERNFHPSASLALLEMEGNYARVTELLRDPNGVIRDPDVSHDATRVLFSWKKSDLGDDYHLYEMRLSDRRIRQITFGLGFADYEGIYLPDGDLLFNSTRPIQAVDCWWTEVSNLYRCDGNGECLRRLTFDQVHDNYPTLTADGRILYTRWEYNDRGQIYPQPLYQMNPDGTGQTEFYGNNSWFPTTILHARGIPDNQKVLAILTGHHSLQMGKLAVIDPARGRQENHGVQLVAPVRETRAERIDSYGQQGELFQYPYPLGENACLVAYDPDGHQNGARFGIYFMRVAGQRELLVSDPAISCNQPIPVAPRSAAAARPSSVDYTKDTGVYAMQDIHAGPGLKDVPRGTVKKLRVVALDYRAAAVTDNGNSGEAGAALVSTPPGIDNTSWDPKRVLGEATVYADGSALFEAPARTPLYFQAVDDRGRVVQTMRSWSTLQPGEKLSCVGCHESKNAAPPTNYGVPQAMKAGIEKLKPFHDSPRGFSFQREIQPILDRHCVSCHAREPQVRRDPAPPSLEGRSDTSRGPRRFSDAYLTLTRKGQINDIVNWVSPQSAPPMLAPYSAGSAKSKLFDMLEKGHGEVQLSRRELDTLACWIDLLVPFCGDYIEAHNWSVPDQEWYMRMLGKRLWSEQIERRGVATLAARGSGPGAPVPETPLRIELLRCRLEGLQTFTDAQTPGRLEAPGPRQPGDQLFLRGPRHLRVRLGNLPESTVYCPDGALLFQLPPAEMDARPPEIRQANPLVVTVRPATQEEVRAYRNLAINPLDQRGTTSFFPHATSNSECRNEAVFAARNAIDGESRNQGHGAWPFQSWGPDPREDLWWEVDFGRSVSVDKAVLSIRADFPHDRAWTSGVLEFSDGTTVTLALKAEAAPQSFSFPRRTTTRMRIHQLRQPQPLGWCGFTEVEVWGREE